MKKHRLMFNLTITSLIIAGLFLFTGITYAQQIHCPTNAQARQKACNQKKAYIRNASGVVDKWDRNMKNSGRQVLMPWSKMTKQQYKGWRKPNSIQRYGRHFRVFGTFRDSRTNIAYLLVNNGDYAHMLNGYHKGNRSAVQSQYNTGINNSRRLMRGSIAPKINRIKAKLQQAELFLSQCCGYRWTNDVGRMPEVRQPPKPQGPQRGLLGIEP